MQKKLIFILFFVGFAAWSCKKVTINISMPTAKMVSVLADIHFAESIVVNMSPQKKDSILPIYEKQIFDIHGITEQAFVDDLQRIKQDPAVTEKVYKMVSDTIAARIKAVSH
jgi:Domain of unknown function (DUF4296)